MTTNMATDPWAQLMWLRDLTRRTGVLHEAQVLQIKLYPHTVSKAIRNVEATVDMKKKVVTYTCDVTKREADFKKRTQMLGKCICELLGDEWQTVVKAGAVTYKVGKTSKK